MVYVGYSYPKGKPKREGNENRSIAPQNIETKPQPCIVDGTAISTIG